MSDSGNLRKVTKIILILFSGLFLSGCYSLKTIPVNSALSFPQKRSILVIHTDDNFWAIDDFAITGNDLTGEICPDSLKLSKLKVAHVYVAPADAVRFDGIRLTIPTGNIGKADFYRADWWRIVGTSAVIALFGFTLSHLFVINQVRF
jgi:hypothetical protein